MKFKKLDFSRLIFEFISVSFAVLFALFVNQWREDHNNKNIAEKAVFNIKEELKENKEIMVLAIPDHKNMLSEIDQLIKISENQNTVNDTLKAIDITLISSSAWEIAKITNAVFYIDFENVNNLAKVYDLQSYYESIVKQYVLKNAMSQNNNMDINQLKNTRQFLKTIIPLEVNLEHYYGLMLKEVLTE